MANREFVGFVEAVELGIYDDRVTLGHHFIGRFLEFSLARWAVIPQD